jgi:SAM-dependent methyltransferase
MKRSEGLPTVTAVDDPEEMVEPAVPERLRWMIGMLDPQPGERIADLGCGTGDALAMIAGQLEADLIGIDSSAGALQAAARTLHELPGRSWLLVRADLSRSIPLAEASVKRALCHNVLEFLADPGAFVNEVHRVLKPGGRFVLSHSDFDTLVFASEDLGLTRRLIRAYCDTQQAWMDSVDGTIGRRLAHIVQRSPLQLEDMQARANLSLRFRPGELGYGYAHNLTHALRAAAQVDPAELDGWLAGLRRLDDEGGFLFSINDYAVACRRP